MVRILSKLFTNVSVCLQNNFNLGTEKTYTYSFLTEKQHFLYFIGISLNTKDHLCRKNLKIQIMKIGFIGLGIMGSRMATNLQKASYELILYNRTQEKAKEMIENGATWAKTPLELAQKSDLVITMLSTPEVVKEMAIGPKGFFNGMKANALWINCSTVNPSFSVEIGRIAHENGFRYLDAPVAGTKGPAENGELLFFVGGTEGDLKEAQPLFDVMGKKTLHLGKVGKGASVKMLVNQLLGQQMAAFAEALIMGEAMGIQQKTVLDVLLSTPVVAPVMAAVRPKLENDNYEANFPLKWLHKDLHLSSISAYEEGIAAPNLHATKELFGLAKQHGYGENDFTALYSFLRRYP
ncbi:NAD(P)-dependent oxidoreductase [Sungkyunkwania multivorans]|uniref:NAD(P)-dependent oxidoreductase n=1 Tax=Sungkyunkwania multivorans TaxID=1173618 RepID=A0ABW3D297_9FLAO